MSESTSRLTTALADRYNILRRLGEGGMATQWGGRYDGKTVGSRFSDISRAAGLPAWKRTTMVGWDDGKPVGGWSLVGVIRSMLKGRLSSPVITNHPRVTI